MSMTTNKQTLRNNAESIIGILENIAGFEPSDIDGDSVELRFEDECGFDTGCVASIVEQCQKAADVVLALLDELERLSARNAELNSTLERWATDRAQSASELEAAERRNAEIEGDNAYIRNRHKELDLLIGKNILVMQAAIIEWQGTGDARKGLAWIYNTLFGPGELPSEDEKDAQSYFDRKYAPLDEELMNLHRWFWEQSEAERAAATDKGGVSMSRYIAVIHGWHVDSNGFDIHELNSPSREDAYNEAVILKHKRERTFDKCAFTVVEIADHEKLSRKLTLRERLTGRTNP